MQTRVAVLILSSETRTKSSSSLRRICCGNSNTVRVASPSAKVLLVSVPRMPARQDRYAAGPPRPARAEPYDAGFHVIFPQVVPVTGAW